MDGVMCLKATEPLQGDSLFFTTNEMMKICILSYYFERTFL